MSTHGLSASRLPLLALAIASFGIGTTEFVIMGLLPDVATDLAVTIPQAGLLVTGYALSVTFGSPILAIATARMQRKRALLVLIAIFILGNLLCAVAPGYALLMAARIVTALCHGAFFGLGAVVAAALVEPHRRAQAIAMMFAGLTLANVLGVPFGTALGQALGWRDTFFAVAAIGVLAALALQAWLPRELPVPPMDLAREARSLGRVQVLLAMLISVVTSASLFSVFTYIAPILEQVSGVSQHGVTLMLLLFGVGLTIGNVLGGRLADARRPGQARGRDPGWRRRAAAGRHRPLPVGGAPGFPGRRGLPAGTEPGPRPYGADGGDERAYREACVPVVRSRGGRGGPARLLLARRLTDATAVGERRAAQAPAARRSRPSHDGQYRMVQRRPTIAASARRPAAG
ncbi:hypothetical protein GCM10010994_52170 [Chelatococcus reniformis]|uniref:Major facilitator superfamily (MFS) profile domain-containing protein n=1 Tax=Chelatococcus reniformis TaxID=1494448 RepID=A0A916UTJ1_9HYPH|nr:hypothetical protein GCM10010994_52170 [Chelatococcus reniformis]